LLFNQRNAHGIIAASAMGNIVLAAQGKAAHWPLKV
jgi:hypothetical protein